MNTKETIRSESLRLFSEKGFDAVSVADIADAVGIRAPSLYKHYASKSAILDAVLRDVEEADAEKAADFSMPQNEKADGLPAKSDIVSFSCAMFSHWTEAEYFCRVRRFLTIEQYKSARFRTLYAQLFTSGPLAYMTEIFRFSMQDDEKSRLAAMRFYAPMTLCYSLFDEGEPSERLLSRLRAHFESCLAENGM